MLLVPLLLGLLSDSDLADSGELDSGDELLGGEVEGEEGVGGDEADDVEKGDKREELQDERLAKYEELEAEQDEAHDLAEHSFCLQRSKVTLPSIWLWNEAFTFTALYSTGHVGEYPFPTGTVTRGATRAPS